MLLNMHAGKLPNSYKQFDQGNEFELKQIPKIHRSHISLYGIDAVVKGDLESEIMSQTHGIDVVVRRSPSHLEVCLRLVVDARCRFWKPVSPRSTS